MLKPAKSRAEERFAETRKKENKLMKERETERQEKAELVARLRGLRLAKEAADKIAAEAEAAEKEAAKKKRKTTRSPKAV